MSGRRSQRRGRVPLSVLASLASATVVLVVAGAATSAAPPVAGRDAHTVELRVVAGAPALYDRSSAAVFTPIGANYIRLAAQRTAAGSVITYHSTFNVGSYDAARAAAALARMRADRFNTVRVFLDPLCTASCLGDASGLRQAYVANFASFLRLAAAEHMFVIPTIDFLPTVGPVAQLLGQSRNPLVAGPNTDYLADAGVAAEAQFWKAFIGSLLTMKAPLDTILAYELRNEVAFDAAAAPLTLSGGHLTTPDGRGWKLGSAIARRQMLEDALVWWIDRTRAAIRSVDPSALVAIGFAAASNGPDAAGLMRVALDRSEADIVDVHVYPGEPPALPTLAATAGLGTRRHVVLLMGELGGFKRAFPSAAAAAAGLAAVRAQSCGYGFAGWLLWTWDTAEQPALWNALSDGGVIAGMLTRVAAARSSCSARAVG